MVEKVSYMVVLKDMLSAGMSKLAVKGNSAYNKLITKQRVYNKTVIAGAGEVGTLRNSIVGLKSLMAGYIGFNLGSNILKWGSEMEQARISFQTLLQDVEKGNTLFEELNEFANETPYKNEPLIKGAKTLLSFGIAGEKVMGTLKMIGNIAGGTQSRMENLTLAYAQTQAAGKLMGQDNLQYINAGFNPLKILAVKTGKSLGYMQDQMRKGAVSSEMVSWAFQQATSKGGMFYGMLDKLSKTIGGKWSTLVGRIQFKLGGFVESNNKFITSILDGLISMVEFLDTHSKIIGTLLAVLASAIAGYYAWIAVMKLQMVMMALYKSALFIQIGLTRGWAVAQRALNMALLANPIGLVIAAIAVLAYGIYYAWNKFEGFRKVVLGVWGVIKGFGTIIKDYVINRITELLRGISGIGKAFSLLFEGKFKAAAEAGSKALGNIVIGHESKQKAWQAGKTLGEAYNKGAAKAIRPDSKNKEDPLSVDNPLTTDASGGTPDPVKTGSVIGGISSTGASSTKNITISIGSLIQGNIEFHTTNITEGLEDLKDKVSEVLLQAVNDANLATG